MQDDMKRKERERIEEQRRSVSSPSLAPRERVRSMLRGFRSFSNPPEPIVEPQTWLEKYKFLVQYNLAMMTRSFHYRGGSFRGTNKKAFCRLSLTILLDFVIQSTFVVFGFLVML